MTVEINLDERGFGMTRQRYEQKFCENDDDIQEIFQDSDVVPTHEE